MSHILVLGVGNVLMSDEGVGIQCIHRLSDCFSFSENIRILDGGTLGLKLIGPISEAASLIVVDCAIQGFAPGTISRLSIEAFQAGSSEKHSMHEVSFLEMLFIAQSMGTLPPTVIFTIEPLDITTERVALTPPIAEKLEDLCDRVLHEIKISGGMFSLKEAGQKPWTFDLRISEINWQ